MIEEDISYTEAMAELEGILDEIEGDDLDVDRLASRVERASHLVELCRARILRAKAEVDAIVTDLDSLEVGIDDAEEA